MSQTATNHALSLSREAVESLGRRVRGAIRTDIATRGAYATDASMYQFEPLAVIEPLDRDDIVAAVKVCAEHRLPILPRGGGTSLVGQCIGRGVVIDVSRHCHRLLEVHADECWARVEPGMIRDELNRRLAGHRLHFAPDPATTSRANIGGMIANNAAGMRSIQYGMTIDHVLSVDIVLADGEVMTLGPVDSKDLASPASDRPAMIRQAVHRIIERERDEIAARYPRVGRRSGGYALDALANEDPMNLAKLIAGSEGTLGLILEARIRLEPVPAHSGLCLAHFTTIGACLRAVEPIVRHKPSAVELLDGVIVRQAREHPMTRPTCAVIDGNPEGLLVIEARSDDRDDVRGKLEAIRLMLLESGACYHAPIMTEPTAIQAVWLMRESALGLMTTVKGERKPTPYIEDAAVPPAVLPAYIEDVLAICKRHGQPVSLFAHAGAGLLHIRPLHNLHDPADIERMKQIQDEVFERVVHYGGSWSGEHGDGIIRGGFNERFFGPRLYQAFREIKALFDPDGRMNPGKTVDTYPRDENLRFDRGHYRPEPITTAYRWQADEGLLRAAEQCTGVGACRKLSTGVMCPSYMATRDEVHSTRGRANVLRLALTGQLGRDALTRSDVKAVFDLCLSCKGCVSECPNKVDVGKMKAELQHQYYQRHRRPLRSHLFARAGLLGQLQSGRPAPVFNALLQSKPIRLLLDRTLGIDARRHLPAYAQERLSRWFRRCSERDETTSDRPRVILFNDVYMEHHEPAAGQAAVRVLETAGYEVTLLDSMDSQRPALSQGMLDRARIRGGEVIRKLLPYAKQGIPILVVEPSCATALLQDLPDLVENGEDADTVKSAVQLADAFLADSLSRGLTRLPPISAPGLTIFYHPHCHQRSIDGGRGTRTLLDAIQDAAVIESKAGCCGMAGAFGYEKEHYDLSVQVAGDRLIPALNSCPANTRVVACGFSCRHQIADLTGRRTVHPFQLIDELLQQQEKEQHKT